LPGIRALVPRSQSITVKYQNRDAEWIEAVYDGFLARVFQHEFDHLNGIVFLDRIETSLDVMMEAEWQKQFIKS
jgi:peptide deformylase